MISDHWFNLYHFYLTSVHSPTFTLYIFLKPVFYLSILLDNNICGTVFEHLCT